MKAPATNLRGWVEIYTTAAPTPGFEVYDWSEHHDSGARIGWFATREEATSFVTDWAAEHGRKVSTADLYSLADYRGEEF